MVATMQQRVPRAGLSRWEPDQELVRHFIHRTRYLTSEEIQAAIAQIDHILWMADDAGIEHSTSYLVELASERVACERTLAYRDQRRYQYRAPTPPKFSRATLEMLKAHSSLTAEIGRTLTLTRRGKNYVARCPFHLPDRTPSFTVFVETQTYHCFGCLANGDIFTWLMETSRLSFPEAVQEVADRCGLPLDAGQREGDRQTISAQRPDSRGGTQGSGGINFEFRAGKLVDR